MNRSITQRGARTARFRFASETTVSTFGALMLASGLAHGADAGPAAPAANEGELETVIVTGIRAGIQDAITLKRENFSIVEAISAEDIGKLPDTSIAESISRLPGLTSQRAEGRASAISLAAARCAAFPAVTVPREPYVPTPLSTAAVSAWRTSNREAGSPSASPRI